MADDKTASKTPAPAVVAPPAPDTPVKKVSPYIKGTEPATLNKFERAFAHMVAISEGTFGEGDDGYNVLVGSTPQNIVTFPSYDDHPRIKVWLEHLHDYSTAAGKYQILAHIFDFYKGQLQCIDFSPAAQDRIFQKLCQERRVQAQLEQGQVQAAILAASSCWASLPGSTYGQHVNRMDSLVLAYNSYLVGLDRVTPA